MQKDISNFASKRALNLDIAMPPDLKIRPFQDISTPHIASLGHAQYLIMSQHLAPHINPSDNPHEALRQAESTGITRGVVLLLTNHQVSSTRNSVSHFFPSTIVDDCAVHGHIPGSSLIFPSCTDLVS